MKKKRLKLTKRLRIPRREHEEYLREQGFEVVCGLDEVGRGAWAGPLVAGAVILPPAPQSNNSKVKTKKLYGIRDSKLLSPKEREKLAKKIRKTCKFGIGEVSVEEINKLKLTKATQLAFTRALRNLRVNCDFVLIDGNNIKLYPEYARGACRALKRGDMICSSIAAASIVAKVYRDRLMRRLDKEIKGYYFGKHKGYGTKLHQNRLNKLGPSKAHRMFNKSIK